MTNRVDTEAITARLKNATDYTGPIGDRVDFKAALLHAEFHAYAPGDIASLLAEVARLREALRAFVESDAIVNYDSSLCWGCGGTRHERYETSPLDEHDANCILARGRAALQAVEETPT